MTFEELKDKALTLPLAPGVYIMRDRGNTVIYVGKAKKLKNRVSQYFQDTASHSPKTRQMVSKIHHFDVIVAASEFEALVLECSLIKRYMPKYNILLKDDKGYPYIRMDFRDPYPSISIAPRIMDDGAEYFGPFGSRGVTTSIITAVTDALKLPSCKKQFPKDLDKERPCLNYHMNRCAGWCQSSKTRQEYQAVMEQARQLLQGNYRSVAAQIKEEMMASAENLDFEIAASLRDKLKAVEALGQKQLVTAATLADTDVIGYGEYGSKACFAVLHFSGGNLLDKDYEIFPVADDKEAAVSSLMKQYYLSRGVAPKFILLPFSIDDSQLFAQLLEQQYGKKLHLRIPQRGDNMRLVELACTNAQEEARRIAGKEEKHQASVLMLGKALGIAPPSRIESYDISNISGTDIVAGMVVFQDGKPHKSAYKKFKLRDMDGQDDYGAMRQVLLRRFQHLIDGDSGFTDKPDLLLIDGGITHAATALEALQNLNLDIPVFGMVKDDRHRTRALVTPQGDQIRIDHQQVLFSFIGSIQEEVHRYAIGYHRQLRSKRLRYSELDRIPGIGPVRKQMLLKSFRSIAAIKEASPEALQQLLPKDAAMQVYRYFHQKEEG